MFQGFYWVYEHFRKGRCKHKMVKTFNTQLAGEISKGTSFCALPQTKCPEYLPFLVWICLCLILISPEGGSHRNAKKNWLLMKTLNKLFLDLSTCQMLNIFQHISVALIQEPNMVIVHPRTASWKFLHHNPPSKGERNHSMEFTAIQLVLQMALWPWLCQSYFFGQFMLPPPPKK